MCVCHDRVLCLIENKERFTRQPEMGSECSAKEIEEKKVIN